MVLRKARYGNGFPNFSCITEMLGYSIVSVLCHPILSVPFLQSFVTKFTKVVARTKLRESVPVCMSPNMIGRAFVALSTGLTAFREFWRLLS